MKITKLFKEFFDNETTINIAKLIILLSSLVAGTFGLLSLKLTLKKNPAKSE